MLQQGEGTEAQPVAGTLFPATHRPTSLPWAEKLLIDQEEGGGGEAGGGGGREEEVNIVRVGGHLGREEPCGEGGIPTPGGRFLRTACGNLGK